MTPEECARWLVICARDRSDDVEATEPAQVSKSSPMWRFELSNGEDTFVVWLERKPAPPRCSVCSLPIERVETLDGYTGTGPVRHRACAPLRAQDRWAS